MSDAVLWMAKQPVPSYTGRVETISGLRKKGIVRPFLSFRDAVD